MKIIQFFLSCLSKYFRLYKKKHIKLMNIIRSTKKTEHFYGFHIIKTQLYLCLSTSYLFHLLINLLILTFRNIFDNHKLNFVKQMLKKNGLSNDWLDTLIALSDLVIGELSPDLSTDTENMSICQ